MNHRNLPAGGIRSSPAPERRSRGDRRSEHRGATPERRRMLDRRWEGNERYVTFWVGENHLGVNSDQVREILDSRPLARVPLAPGSIPGLLNIRGQIVCALDLRIHFGLEVTGSSAMNVVVRDRSEMISLLVDRVGDVLEVSRSALRPPPATMSPRWRDICHGVVRLGDQGLLMVVDVTRIIDGVEDSTT